MVPRLDTWRWKAALALGSTVLALLLAALAGEAAVRYRESHRHTVPGTMPLLFYRHVRLGYALVRDYNYFGWVHVNRQGFRGSDVAMDKPPGTTRIIAVGGSTTFDTFVSRDEAAWPARTQFWLKQLAPQRPVEVINAGVPGYRVIDDLVRLQTELYQYQPDVIILYQAHNDLFAALRRGTSGPPPDTDTPLEMPAVTPWRHWLERHSLLYTKLAERVQIRRFHGIKPRDPDSAPLRLEPTNSIVDSAVRQFERDVRAFLAVARSLGIRVVIPEVVQVSGVGASEELDPVVRKMWSRTVPFVRPETVLLGYARYNLALRRVSAQYSAPFLPIGRFELAGTAFYGDDDPIHFNDRGADVMGRKMAEALLAAGVLDSPATGERGPPQMRTSLP